MRKVFVQGVGMTSFGRFPEISVARLGAAAVMAAISDAGITWRDIPVIYCSNNRNGACVGELIEAEIAHTGIPVFNVNNACAGGQTAFYQAYQMVAHGAYDLALVVGAEQMPRGPIEQNPNLETLTGASSMVSKYAMKMQRAVYERRYTLDQMARVSVKNHNNACLNPLSQYKIRLSIQDVHNSRLIADPLTLYHCCPTGDGAAAAVLCSGAVIRKYKLPPYIEMVGGALCSQTFVRGEPNETRLISVNTAREAYRNAGIGPEDLDIVELHDNFTISELEHYEDLGLCPDNTAGEFLEKGNTEITGKVPVNVSGGLLGKGHPTGATGIAQICEIVWQMKGLVSERQVKDPKVGLSHCCGGDLGMACGVNILKR